MIRALVVTICLLNFSVLFGGKKSDKLTNCEAILTQAKSELLAEEFTKLKKSIDKLSEKSELLSQSCKVDLLLLKGKYYYNDGDAEFALAFFKDAKELSLENSFSDRFIESTYFLALSYIDENDKQSSAEVLDELLGNKEELGQSDFAHKVYEIRSMLHSIQGEHEKAMVCLKASLSHLSEDDAQSQLMTQLLNQVATNYQTLGKVDSSIYYYNQLIDLKLETNDGQGLLSDYNTLGGLYKEIGSYEKAQQSFMNAIKKGEELKDSLSLLSTYIDIAKVYLEQRLVDPALEYTEKAEQLAKEKNALLIEGQSYQLKGAILERVNQKDRALLFYNKALAVFEKLGLKKQIADVHLSIADLFGEEENLEKAELALRKVLDIRLQSEDKTGELNTKLSLSKVSLRLNKNMTQVESWIKDCFIIASETNNKTALQKAYFLQSTLDEKLGNFNSALSYYKKHNYVRDSILNQENATIVRELEKRYQTAEKNKEIALQQKQISVQELALKKRSTQVVQLLSGFLVLMILSFLTFITYQRNKVFNQQKLSVIEKEKETQILRAMVSGEEQERRRIARDLHDGLGANLATVKMRINALRNNIPGIQEHDSYNKAEQLIDDACENIREISHNMMPGSLSRHGLEVALQDICEAIQAANNIEVAFIPFGLEKIIDDVVEINIYRIIQELLKNVVKHAQAKEVIVQLTLEESDLHIVVEDDGKGFDTKKLNVFDGIGMGSIQSRVIYLNGKIDVESNLGMGTTFNIEIPIQTIKNQKLWSKSLS